MRVAVISDIHGNLEALQAVLADIGHYQVDAIDCLGDVIGYGPDPTACIDLIEEKCRIKIMGNHDATALQPSHELINDSWAEQVAYWTQQQLSDHHRTQIRKWPMLSVGTDARLVHGSPREPAQFHYIRDRIDAEITFGYFQEKLCFFGHTHQPMVAEELAKNTLRLHKIEQQTDVKECSTWSLDLNTSCRLLINPGSVGQPRDHDPRARWVLLESQPFCVSVHAVPYSIEKTQEKIYAINLPDFLAERIALGK